MGDLCIFFFCLVAGGYVLYETGTYPPQVDPSMDAGLYPNLLVTTLFILLAIFTVRAVRGRFGKGTPGDAYTPLHPKPLRMIAYMGCYCALMSVAGYALATALFIAAGVVLFKGTLKAGVITGIGATIGLELLFRVAFQVSLPAGWLGLM